MNSTLCGAIRERKTIELRYGAFARLVEPHAYGRDNSGDEILRCYQVSGGSESGEWIGWKLLKVREVFSLHQTGTLFSVRPDYRRNDKAMEYIFCQL
jgi:hypothetical protein